MSVHFYNCSYYRDILLKLIFDARIGNSLNEIRNFDTKTFYLLPVSNVSRIIYFKEDAQVINIESITNDTEYIIQINFENEQNKYCILPKKHAPVLFVNNPYIHSIMFLNYLEPLIPKCIQSENNFIKKISMERRIELTNEMQYRVNSDEYQNLNKNYLVLYSNLNFTGNIQFINALPVKDMSFTKLERHINDQTDNFNDVYILSYVNHTNKNYVLISSDNNNEYNIHKHTISNNLRDKNNHPWYDVVYQFVDKFDRNNPIEFSRDIYSIFPASIPNETELVPEPVPVQPQPNGNGNPKPKPKDTTQWTWYSIFTVFIYSFITVLFVIWLIVPLSKSTAKFIYRYVNTSPYALYEND